MDQKNALGDRGYLMPISLDRNDIWIAPNEIFSTTANAVPMRGKTFLDKNGIKYMESYTLNIGDQNWLSSCFSSNSKIQRVAWYR